MKANEIRIGNYYENNGIRQIEPNDIEMCHRNNKSFNERNKPIELTEQWLKDFGFKEDENRILFGKCTEKDGAFFTYNVMFTDKGYWIIIHRSEGGTNKKMNIGHYNFVHQLQNLYFALAGEELTK